MTQEDKELLLKDLCARLPYHPFFKRKDDIMPLYNINTYCGVIDCIPSIKIEDCRLYLRPMSSMTDEENSHCDYLLFHMEDWLSYYDYLNSRHLDHRGLISKGLALEASANMYK